MLTFVICLAGYVLCAALYVLVIKEMRRQSEWLNRAIGPRWIDYQEAVIWPLPVMLFLILWIGVELDYLWTHIQFKYQIGRWASIALLCSLFALSGCVNIAYRAEGGDNHGPYFCTCTDAKFIAVPFTKPKGDMGVAVKKMCTILWPFCIVDLPLEAAVDTVLLPWDCYRQDKD